MKSLGYITDMSKCLSVGVWSMDILCFMFYVIYYVLCSKTYSTLGSLFWKPTGMRRATGAPAFVELSYCPQMNVTGTYSW